MSFTTRFKEYLLCLWKANLGSVKEIDEFNEAYPGIEELWKEWADTPFPVIRAITKSAADEYCEKEYTYMLTVTVSPSLHPVITSGLVEKIEALIVAQASRPALHLTAFSYVKEFHTNGREHWHIVMSGTKSLKKDYFKTFSKTYGSLDFQRNRSETANSAMTYISKIGDVKTVI